MGIVSTQRLLRTKVFFPKIHELIEKLLAKCVACTVVIKNRKKKIKLKILQDYRRAKKKKKDQRQR